jgi:hypothetical protein
MAAFARPGGPGAKFKTHLDKLYKCLSLPKGAKEELGIAGEETLRYDEEEEQKQANARRERLAEDEELDQEKEAEFERQRYERMMNAALFGEGYYHLIPSFFRTLMYLKKNKREFSLVFRTFGNDKEHFTYEFNRFCSGEHPAFNGRNNTPQVKFDGSKNCKELRFQSAFQHAVMYRQSADISESILVTGEHDRV